MKLSGLAVFSLLLIALALVIPALLYPRLPDIMPTHFDLQGRVNGSMPKLQAIALVPAMMLAIFLVFSVLGRISPRGFGIEAFTSSVDVIRAATIAFIFVIHSVVLMKALAIDVSLNRVVVGSLGLLLMIIGNVLTKTTRNFFIGIRTPWTLASDEVWLRTHRLGARVFVAGGAVVAFLGFLGLADRGVLGLAVMLTLIPVIYSYVIYRRLEEQ